MPHPECGNGFGNGFNIAAHLMYASNGSTTSGAQFAAGKVSTG